MHGGDRRLHPAAYRVGQGDQEEFHPMMARLKAAGENVVQNAKDIAGSVGSVYGREAGDNFFPLPAGHYGAVKEYLNAGIGKRFPE